MSETEKTAENFSGDGGVSQNMVQDESGTIDANMVQDESGTVDASIVQDESGTVDANMVQDESGTVDANMVQDESGTMDDSPKSTDNLTTGPARIFGAALDIAQVPPPPTKAELYKLLRDGLKLVDLAERYNIPIQEIEAILEDTTTAEVTIDLTDEEKCKRLRSELLDVSAQIARKIKANNESEWSDLTRAKSLKTYADALTTIQSGIINQMPKVTLEANHETRELFDALALNDNNE